ncbi:hypothetical protein F5Y10DRAFT_284579 [Nemania abortiva]|nr:hypothetical protein F5Y10DRAFT_284579 [Nemania abortiva]
MVGLVERFKKPKLPIALGSPQTDDPLVHQPAAPRPQNTTLPALRNFSYPTNITKSSTSPSTSETPSTWDQLGEICNFSPDITSRTRRDRAAGLEDPFFYTTDRTPYKQLVDLEEEIITDREARHSTDSKNVENCDFRDKGTKLSKNHSVGDHIFSPKSKITARLKRNSFGHYYKASSSSFDTSRLLARQSNSLERPMSSSGVPLIYTSLTRSSSTAARTIVSPLSFQADTTDGISANSEKSAFTSSTKSDLHVVEMDPFSSRSSPQGQHHAENQSGNQQRNGHASDSHKPKGKGKEGKARWLSQLKEWVAVSEPSTQALRNYKKDTYKKAGVALDDPLANAKLHLPVASLPPDAIKPGGRGPGPEKIALQRAMQRKKALESLPMAGTSQGSRSSASHCSSSSSATMGAIKGGE